MLRMLFGIMLIYVAFVIGSKYGSRQQAKYILSHNDFIKNKSNKEVTIQQPDFFMGYYPKTIRVHRTATSEFLFSEPKGNIFIEDESQPLLSVKNKFLKAISFEDTVRVNRYKIDPGVKTVKK